MDRLHSMLRSLSGERKSAPHHLAVFREFLSHLEKVSRKKTSRKKSSARPQRPPPKRKT